MASPPALEEKEAGEKEEAEAMAQGGASTKASEALGLVLRRIERALAESQSESRRIRLVAVSKTKEAALIKQVYDAGHRCFGENYVRDLAEKRSKLPEDINWHFIGNLQSNKVIPLLSGVPNLAMVETVDSPKIADLLDATVKKLQREPLRVMIQVNTSGEESKSGVEPSNCVPLARHVHQKCHSLRFSGLMTIAMPDPSATPENFKALARCRTEVCQALCMDADDCELSMGMSNDFELAIKMGSTNVRIGSTIFGPRDSTK